ncbi:uncharacterized protein LOC111035536 isoform X2 [Myzus persicae]|uniref:uncharacterized protein LOC111035536 isoform X2 n=1 Tax=Myzus persicae TaxID=13164 RepID=UPI000B937206|nr:uncharacterized protein LOC111035536 isoform X2 [Myzus persicae]
MDKAGESDKKSGPVGEREPARSGGASDRPTATTVERTVDKRVTTGDGGSEVKDKNGNGSDMPPDEVDDEAVSEGKNKIFRLEGAVYSIVPLRQYK